MSDIDAMQRAIQKAKEEHVRLTSKNKSHKWEPKKDEVIPRAYRSGKRWRRKAQRDLKPNPRDLIDGCRIIPQDVLDLIAARKSSK